MDASSEIWVHSDIDVDFANAPTPFMSNNFADLNDIESDDLLDLDFPLIDSEVEVPVNDVPVNHHVVQSPPVQSYHGLDQTHQTTSKRKIEEVYDSEDSSSDEEVEMTYRNKSELRPDKGATKSRAGRKPSKGNKCMSRNAIAARENREKKKAYMMEVEKRLRLVEDDNKKKGNQITVLIREKEDLTNEVNYLRGVLANDSTIGQLIKDMASTNQIQLIGTQFMSSESKVFDAKPVRKSHRIASKGDTSPSLTALGGQTSGICLHIHNKKVSFELCSKCSLKHNSKGK